MSAVTTHATKLVNELVEASEGLVLSKTIARYGRVGLLVVDEIGYVTWTNAAPSSSSKS